MRKTIINANVDNYKTSTGNEISIVSSVRIVSQNGQIFLGKEYAGKQVQIFQQNDTTFILKIVEVIPENELWLYTAENIQRIDKSIKWVESNPRRDNFDEIIDRVFSG